MKTNKQIEEELDFTLCEEQKTYIEFYSNDCSLDKYEINKLIEIYEENTGQKVTDYEITIDGGNLNITLWLV